MRELVWVWKSSVTFLKSSNKNTSLTLKKYSKFEAVSRLLVVRMQHTYLPTYLGTIIKSVAILQNVLLAQQAILICTQVYLVTLQRVSYLAKQSIVYLT